MTRSNLECQKLILSVYIINKIITIVLKITNLLCQSRTFLIIFPTTFHNISWSILTIHKPWWTIYEWLHSSQVIVKSNCCFSICYNLLRFWSYWIMKYLPSCGKDSEGVFYDPPCPAQSIIEYSVTFYIMEIQIYNVLLIIIPGKYLPG